MTTKETTELRKKISPIAFDVADMIMQGILTNRKSKTYHVSKIAKRLQKLIDDDLEEEQKSISCACI